ncbi:hypothetical protein CYY_006415 [Polysphondylium violaceum]|uniref:F-box domain-containing protein n=1 Tax=Polysphondylium violaceum TaxID=133409 RepID=A0A8J4PS96_9MYCE|nr:hypothetical protein CYY_006415 [Polysphondylium violaceum]
MDEENLTKLLQAFSSCNYIEFVKIFSMVHGFDATFEFLRNALTTIPIMAIKRKFFGGGNNDQQLQQQQQQLQQQPIVEEDRPTKRQAIRSTWEEEDNENNQFWTPKIFYDSDVDYHKNRLGHKNKSPNNNNNRISSSPSSSSPPSPSSPYSPPNQILNQRKNSLNSSNLKNNFVNSQKSKHIYNSNNKYYTPINNNSNSSKVYRKKIRSSRISNIEELPFEVIVYILSFLKYSDILIVSLVSKEWNRYSFVATTELTIENRKNLSVEIVNRKIYKHSNYLKKIRCCQLKYFNQQSISMITEHCRNLNDIQLYNCTLIGDAEIDILCKNLTKLTKIVLNSEIVSSKTLDSLCHSKLQEIELGGFSKVPYESFSKLGELSTLKSLDLTGIVNKSADHLCQQISNCKNLTSLRLREASEHAISLLPFLGNLVQLSIAEWLRPEIAPTTTTNQETMSVVTTVSSSVKANSTFQFLDKCKKIENLEISGHKDFILKDLNHVLSVANTLKVLDFDFSYCSDLDEKFYPMMSQLTRLERLFISKFNLSGDCWGAFSILPNLHTLSICCVKMNNHWINRGLEHLGACESLQKLSIINSTEHWITISEKSFSSLLKSSDNLFELRLGGSRGGGWILNEGVFMTIGKFKSLQLLDLSNSRGITESCFVYLSECLNLESLEGAIKVDENTLRSTIAEWCGTGTLVNCPSLRKVSIDLQLPSFINSEIAPENGGGTFNLMAKISKHSPI